MPDIQESNFDVTHFDPPQKKADWAAKMRNINMMTPRSGGMLNWKLGRFKSRLFTDQIVQDLHGLVSQLGIPFLIGTSS